MDEGVIEELDPLIGAVDRHRGAEPVQQLLVAGDMAVELGADLLDVGLIERVSGNPAALVERRLVDLEQPARAVDDHVLGEVLPLTGFQRPAGQRRPWSWSNPAASSRTVSGAASGAASTAAR